MGAPECIVFVRLAEDDEGLAHLDYLTNQDLDFDDLARHRSVHGLFACARRSSRCRGSCCRCSRSSSARCSPLLPRSLHIIHYPCILSPLSFASFNIADSGISVIFLITAMGVCARSIFKATCITPSFHDPSISLT